MPSETIVMRAGLDVDGGTAWKQTLPNNAYSYEQVYKANQLLDVGECVAVAKKAHADAAAKVPK
eukprot:2048943-Pleurochrysis_carterae.AAC.1